MIQKFRGFQRVYNEAFSFPPLLQPFRSPPWRQIVSMVSFVYSIDTLCIHRLISTSIAIFLFYPGMD